MTLLCKIKPGNPDSSWNSTMAIQEGADSRNIGGPTSGVGTRQSQNRIELFLRWTSEVELGRWEIVLPIVLTSPGFRHRHCATKKLTAQDNSRPIIETHAGVMLSSSPLYPSIRGGGGAPHPRATRVSLRIETNHMQNLSYLLHTSRQIFAPPHSSMTRSTKEGPKPPKHTS
jgi:hypothetical protein